MQAELGPSPEEQAQALAQALAQAQAQAEAQAQAQAQAQAERVEHAGHVAAADYVTPPYSGAPCGLPSTPPPHARRTPLGNPADGAAAVLPAAASVNVPAGGPLGGKHASARPAAYPPPRVAPDEPSENSPPAAPTPPGAGVGSSQADPILL